MSYRPKEPFATVAQLYNPAETSVKGVLVKTYESAGIIFCSFKTYGGTESVQNNVLTVEDTARVETWFREDIKSNSRIVVGTKTYEVIGEPEDIEQRHQFLKFTVRGVRGGA